jgi:hypothetical protein
MREQQVLLHFSSAPDGLALRELLAAFADGLSTGRLRATYLPFKRLGLVTSSGYARGAR